MSTACKIAETNRQIFVPVQLLASVLISKTNHGSQASNSSIMCVTDASSRVLGN